MISKTGTGRKWVSGWLFAAFFLVAGSAVTLYSGNNLEARLAEADRLFRASFFPAAGEMYEELLPLVEGAQRHEVMYRIAFSLQRQGAAQGRVAIDRYAELLAEEGVEPTLRANALLQRAVMLSNNRRDDEAQEMWGEVLVLEGATEGQVGMANLMRGYNLNRQGRTEEAIAAFEATFANEGTPNVNRGSAMMAIGSIHLRNREYEAARETYQRALDLGGIGAKNVSDIQGRLEEIDAVLSGDPAFWLDPYPVWVLPDSAVVQWVSMPEQGEGRLTLIAPDGTESVHTSSKEAVFRNREELRHQVELEGLKPSTQYRYRVEVGESQREGSFRTAPVPGERRPIRFIVIGDTQDFPERATLVAERIGEEEEFDFVLHLGDLIGRGTDWGHWKVQYFDPARPYLSRAPVFPTYGNHDGGPFYAPLFGLGRQLYHKVTWGNVDVFVLQSHGTGGRHREQQVEWLRQGLADSTADWKIAIFHYPMFYGGQVPNMRRTSWGQDDFLPVMQEGGLDFALVGHHHVYARFMPLLSSQPGGLVQIISGGGGGGIGWSRETAPSPVLVDGGVTGELHYGLFTVEGETLQAQFINVDGEEIDSFKFQKDEAPAEENGIDWSPITAEVMDRLEAVYFDFLIPGSNRHEIPSNLSELPAPGETIELSWPAQLFPAEGGRLLVSRAPDNPWIPAVEALTLNEEGGFTLPFITPEDFTNFRQQPVRVTLQLEYQGRLYQPHTFTFLVRVGD